MIGEKAGAAGAKHSREQSIKRKRVTKADRRGVAGISGPGYGGPGVSGELDRVADLDFHDVRGSPSVVEIKRWWEGYNVYVTVKGGPLVAAIIRDVFRLLKDPNYPEARLNILKVGRLIHEEAQIQYRRIGKRFLLKFLKRHLVKLPDDSLDAQFPLKLEGLTKNQFAVLKKEIIKLGRQCFEEVKKEITGDCEQHVQGRRRVDLDAIQPPLLEDVLQEDDHVHAWKDQIEKLVAKFAPSNGKLLDAKGKAAKSALIAFLEDQLEKLEPVQTQWDRMNDLEIYIDSSRLHNMDLGALNN